MIADATLPAAPGPAARRRGVAEFRPFLAALWICAFFYLYSISLRALPEPLYSARILALVAMCVLAVAVVRSKGKVAIHSDVVVVIAVYMLYASWTGWRTIATGSSDWNLFANALLILGQVFPGAVLLAHAFARRDATFRDLIAMLHALITIQAVLILLTFVSMRFRSFTLDLLHEGARQVEDLHPFRVRGLTHSTGAKLSGFQALGILFAVYLLMSARSLRQTLYLSASIALIIGSILLTGRTGFLMLPLAILFGVLYVLMRRRLPRGAVGASLLLPLGIIAGFFALRFLYFSESNAVVGAEVFDRLVRWVLKEFVRYTSSDSFASSTVADLLERHWFLPSDSTTLLVGQPETWEVGRVHSDVGPVRMIFGTGLVGITLLYSAFLTMWAATLVRLRAFEERLMMCALLLWFVVIELKEPILVDLRFLSLLALLMVFSIVQRTRLRANAAG